MYTYWKIQFNGEHEGEIGWLPFDENKMAQQIVDEDGKVIVEGRDYTPIEFDTFPEWAK